ncbi:MAG: DUF4259 domain-containing protein [Alphaproteobacteria bacterium]|nr:DUF4259 domain-containing protein [Alphaproteobacteria bacterium]
MGTWGVGAFDNDTAADWATRLGRARGWEVVRKPLGSPGADPEVVVAAAEVVAAACGHPADEVPDELARFVARAGRPDEALVGAAISAVDAVLAEGSELRALWAEVEDFPSWVAALEELRLRLRGEAVPPKPPLPTGIPWTRPDVVAFVDRFLASADWTPAGRAAIDAVPLSGRAREPAVSLGLAAAEAVAAVLGRPSPLTPPEVVRHARQLDLPAMFVVHAAVHAARKALEDDTRRRGGTPAAERVDLLARLVGSDPGTVRDTPGLWHPAAVEPDLPSTWVPGPTRKRKVEAGDVVALHDPDGWLVGRVLPAPGYVLPRHAWLWFYRGVRGAPDDLADARFDDLWRPPQMVPLRLLKDPRLHLLDAALRAHDDGAPRLPDAVPLPWPGHEARPVADLANPALRETLDDLTGELRWASGLGLHAYLVAVVRHDLVHGQIEDTPGAAFRPVWRWRRSFPSLPGEEVAARLRAVLPEAGDPVALRRAWMAEVAGRAG